MKKIILILISIVIVVLIVFKLISNKRMSESKVYQFNKEKSILVDVDTIRLNDINEERTFTGIFEPNREVKISSETQGKINSIMVEVGDYIKQGQTLIQLDNSLLKLQLQTIEVQIEDLKNDIKRYTILTEADAVQGVQLEKLKMGLKSAEVQEAIIKEQINKTTIKAPFSGIVTARLSEIGAFAAPGVSLLQITDISVLKFTINVAEMDLQQFNYNHEYKLIVDAYPDINLQGELNMIGSKANMGNSFPIQFRVKNTKQLDIKSGMFGKVKLSTSETRKGILLPSYAIMNEGNKEQVYIIRNGKSVLQNITTGENIGDKIIISSGLNLGDIVITKGFINLFDGAIVSINNN